MSDEWAILKSQSVISSWGGTRKLPFAFTEQVLAVFSGICPQFCGDINQLLILLENVITLPYQIVF